MSHPDFASQQAHDDFERRVQQGIETLARMRFSPPMSVGALTFVVCLRCGSMVLLQDQFADLVGGHPTPVDQHYDWHASVENGAQ